MADLVDEPARECSACGIPIEAGEYRLLLVGRGAVGRAVYFFVHHPCRDNPVLPANLRVVGAGYTT